MEKTTLAIIKWNGKKDLAEISRQNMIMNGAKRKEVSAIDAYLTLFSEFINDLIEIKNEK